MAKDRNPRLTTTPRARGAAMRWVVVGVVLSVLGAVILLLRHSSTRRNPPSSVSAPEATSLAEEQTVFSQYQGSAGCRECHEDAFAAWEHSNHALAERFVNPDRDRAAFDPSQAFQHGTQTSTVLWTNDSAAVVSAGLSGQPETHAIARVIGNDPLRQFLVPFPGGRFQTLEASYDPHAKEWFNVYGQEDRKPGEWGHWTGRGMNWNFMCAGCHNTRLRRNYDESTDRYHTTMAEMSVGCEACHGPLKAHDQWQHQFGKTGQKDPTLRPLPRPQMMETCGACHARRTELTRDFAPGESFSDYFALALVDDTQRYYADGQVRDEDYEYGSFLGSRMHARGVTCLDCHNPHSAKTILPGNWLCLRCHAGADTNAPVINPVLHSAHKVYGYDTNGVLVNNDLLNYDPKRIKETGGECVNCHMPQTVYMQRHWRHDHGFTIPDPLLTKQFNIPNACNRCHPDQNADWALAYCDKWYGPKMNRPSRTRSQAIARAQEGDPAAWEALLKIVRSETSPYWRAVLLGLLTPSASRQDVSAVLLLSLEDTNELVRAAAAQALEPVLPRRDVAQALTARLEDSSRSVRLAAAWALRASLDPGSRAGRDLQLAINANADQPGGQLRAGDYLTSRNELEGAVLHYQKAVAWDPYSPAFRQQLAIVLCRLQRPREAVDTLREACRLNPEDAESHYQLGLAWNEAGDLPQTCAELDRTVHLNPRHARAWYNLGLAQNQSGQTESALVSLSRAESVDSRDARIPYARATILARLGETQAAVTAARRALEINPHDQDARQLLRELGQ